MCQYSYPSGELEGTVDFERIGEFFFDNLKIAASGLATPDCYCFKLLNPGSDYMEEYVRVRVVLE